jgi:hypothetical protein
MAGVERVYRKLCILLILFALAGVLPAADELNLFEWTAIAPIIVAGAIMGNDGAYVDVVVTRPLKGNVAVNDTLRVAIRRANRNRSRNVDPKSLKLETGGIYVFLLEEFRPKPTAEMAHRLVRGVRGTREVPREGDEAFFGALEQLIEIHEFKSDNITWKRFAAMLEQNNPLLLQIAIDQMLKFRRGEPQLVMSLRPLLDHPRPDLRERAARLMGQLVERHGSEGLPEAPNLRGELVGVARRDSTVEVRVAATEALGGFDDEAMSGVLRQIAATDPERAVRYAAERLLLLRGKESAENRYPAP